MHRRAIVAIGAAALFAVACVPAPHPSPEVLTDEAVDPTWDDGLTEEVAALDTDGWVTVADPERAAPGYTLILYRRRVPLLIDLAGRVVHAWPRVRAVGRARVTEQGNLYLISQDDTVQEYDWDGNLLFEHRLPGRKHFPHHDLIKLQNSNYLILGRSRVDHRDYLREIDPRGEVVWSWNLVDHSDDFPQWDHEARDPGHINSICELVENRWFAGGDERFRPGNLLISARNMSTVFIVDRPTGEIAWQASEGLDYQHEALMIPEGLTGAGQILVFNNGYNDRHAFRRSRVQTYNPQTGEVDWEYGSPFFFSSIAGVAQPLWNDNFLVASSHGGRIFETTRDGDIVWQLEPPFMPMRPARYPPDHCPQLARIPRTDPPTVVRDAPFIDRDLYSFLLPDEGLKNVEGIHGKLLPTAGGCRQLMIPPEASLRLRYGFGDATLDSGPIEARFVAELRQPDGERLAGLLDHVLRSDSGHPGLSQTAVVSLEDYPYHTLDLCLDAITGSTPDGIEAKQATLWGDPKIRLSGDRRLLIPKPTEAMLRFREEQLKAIGYVQ
jgi:outer membrane protein assembly factor BamB